MAHSRSTKKFKHIRNSFLIHQLAHSFISNGFIKTTLTRAKALRMFLEPLITIGRKTYMLQKNNVAPEQLVPMRRLLFKKLKNKEAAKNLMEKIVPAFLDKDQGGYLRIIRSHVRSDSATIVYLAKA